MSAPVIAKSLAVLRLIFLVDLNEDNLINGLVGDTFRILDYPAKGFQVLVAMPDEVRNALRRLIKAGFNKRVYADYGFVIAQN